MQATNDPIRSIPVIGNDIDSHLDAVINQDSQQIVPVKTTSGKVKHLVLDPSFISLLIDSKRNNLITFPPENDYRLISCDDLRSLLNTSYEERAKAFTLLDRYLHSTNEFENICRPMIQKHIALWLREPEGKIHLSYSCHYLAASLILESMLGYQGDVRDFSLKLMNAFLIRDLPSEETWFQTFCRKGKETIESIALARNIRSITEQILVLHYDTLNSQDTLTKMLKNERYTREQAKYNLYKIIIFGQQAIADLLAILLNEYAIHPDWQGAHAEEAKYHTKIDTLISDNSGISHMVLEGLRICGTSVIERKMNDAMTLRSKDGSQVYQIEEGEHLIYSPALVGRLDNKISHPDRFDPNRSITELDKISSRPFGAGHHNFTLQELVLILRIILANIEIERISEEPLPVIVLNNTLRYDRLDYHIQVVSKHKENAPIPVLDSEIGDFLSVSDDTWNLPDHQEASGINS